jgi:hypothetical protein
MAGTNAVAFKQWLVTLLTTAFSSDDVQVSYAFPGEIQRDAVYLGRVTFTHQLMAFKGSGPRISRVEDGTATLYIRTYKPGDKGEEAEERAAELGTALEDALAADPSGSASSIPGLLVTKTASGDLISGADDEAGIAYLTYRIDFRSQLT